MGELALARGAWGAVLLARPAWLLKRVSGEDSEVDRVGARVLGARHLGEATWLALCGEDRPPRWLIGVDLTHAASMVLLARISRRQRPAALASATSAVVLALTGAYVRRIAGGR